MRSVRNSVRETRLYARVRKLSGDVAIARARRVLLEALRDYESGDASGSAARARGRHAALRSRPDLDYSCIRALTLRMSNNRDRREIDPFNPPAGVLQEAV